MEGDDHYTDIDEVKYILEPWFTLGYFVNVLLCRYLFKRNAPVPGAEKYHNVMCARDMYPKHTLKISDGLVGRDP